MFGFLVFGEPVTFACFPAECFTQVLVLEERIEFRQGDFADPLFRLVGDFPAVFIFIEVDYLVCIADDFASEEVVSPSVPDADVFFVLGEFIHDEPSF